MEKKLKKIKIKIKKNGKDTSNNKGQCCHDSESFS